MTVRELKEALNRFEDDLLVLVVDDFNYYAASPIRVTLPKDIAYWDDPTDGMCILSGDTPHVVL